VTPILQDAINRAAVLVTRADGTTVPGRIHGIGGDRRCPNGRCKVQLASGAWITPHIYDVEVVG
jgi:hypothetical protein